VACIIGVESKGDPNAHNRSGASGLGQFLPGTWASTPQGRAGLSVFNPAANRAAIQYMLDAGRAREFDAVRFYGC
jgi:muramidase (phage lysozyme)